MSNEENIEVVEESTQGFAEPSANDNSQSNEADHAREAEDQKRKDAEYNWSEMRRQMREKERQIEEMNRKIADMTAPKTNQEEDYGVNDEDLIEGKHYKKLVKEIRSLEKSLQQKEAATAEERLHLRFPDYADVVTPENIELLKKQKPTVSKSIASMKDPYEQAVAAYELLKEIKGLSSPEDSLEKKRALENSKKPVSVNSIPKSSSMIDLNQFAQMDTKSRKAFLRQKYEEMQESIHAG